MKAAHHIGQTHYSAAPPLTPYVSSYCRYEFRDQLCEDTLFFLPEGIVEIVFQTGMSIRYTHPITGEWISREESFVGGLHTRAYRISMSQAGQAFGIRFRVGCFAYFTEIPVHKIKNQLLSPATVWGKAGQEWQEKMANTVSVDQKIALADQFLQHQFTPTSPFPITELNNYIMDKGGHCRVAELAQIACLSTAQFRHRFNAHFGVPPKTYLQLHRMRRMKQLCNDVPKMRNLAFQLGYYDPSHFHKEVQLITGLSPLSFYQILGS